jgi:hypothetical protein
MKRREFFKKASVASAVLAAVPLTDTLAKPAGQDDQDEGNRERKLRWVIGSEGSALANNGSKITLTGSGAFESGEPNEVSGGGNWTLSTGESGTYRVTALVRFDLAPGRIPNPPNPNVAAIRPGLAFLRIAYSDGSRGILVVSCHLPGTPDSVFEGVTASKGFTDYWNRIPAGTLFQVIRGDDQE